MTSETKLTSITEDSDVDDAVSHKSDAETTSSEENKRYLLHDEEKNPDLHTTTTPSAEIRAEIQSSYEQKRNSVAEMASMEMKTNVQCSDDQVGKPVTTTAPSEDNRQDLLQKKPESIQSSTGSFPSKPKIDVSNTDTTSSDEDTIEYPSSDKKTAQSDTGVTASQENAVPTVNVISDDISITKEPTRDESIMMQEPTGDVSTANQPTSAEPIRYEQQSLNSVIIQDALKQASEESINFIKNQVLELADSKDPYTDNAIHKFNGDISQKILEEFDNTFSVMAQTDTVKQTKDDLNNRFASSDLLILYTARHNHSITNVLKDLKACTIEAERVYEDAMVNFEPNDNNQDKVQQVHSEAADKSREEFIRLLVSKGLKNNEFIQTELEHKLKSSLQELQHNSLMPSLKSATIPNTKSTSIITAHFGAFIDENLIKIYTLEPETKTVGKIVLTQPLKFTATKDLPFEIQVNIYKLMTENLSSSHYSPGFETSSIMVTDEILTHFFKDLHGKLLEKLQLAPGNSTLNLVLVTQFPLTSYQKSRILNSVKVARFSAVRLLSTTIATAAKLFFDKLESQRKEKEPKLAVATIQVNDLSTESFLDLMEIKDLILVISVTELSFSMSIVELNSNAIESKAVYNSVNVSQDFQFLRSHSRVFANASKDGDSDYKAVSEAYEAAKQYLTSICEVDLISLKSIVMSCNDDKIDFKPADLQIMLSKIFAPREVNLLEDFDVALQGACLIALNALQPYEVKVVENVGSKFVTFIYTQQPDGTFEENQQFREMIMGENKVEMQSQGFVAVWEILHSGESVPACYYFITAEPKVHQGSFEVLLSPKVEDGVYSITINFSKANKGKLLDQHLLHLLGQLNIFPFLMPRDSSSAIEIREKNNSRSWWSQLFPHWTRNK